MLEVSSAWRIEATEVLHCSRAARMAAHLAGFAVQFAFWHLRS